MKGFEVKQISLAGVPEAVAITAMVIGKDGNIYVGLTGRGHVRSGRTFSGRTR